MALIAGQGNTDFGSNGIVAKINIRYFTQLRTLLKPAQITAAPQTTASAMTSDPKMKEMGSEYK